MGFDGVLMAFRAKKYTTWPATQVSLGTVKAGLGGHEAGVFGVDEGVENTLIPIRKLWRTALSELRPKMISGVLKTIISARNEMERGCAVEKCAFLVIPDAT